MSNLPAHAQAEVQRVLDGAARRMLDEHMSGKADHSDLFVGDTKAAQLPKSPDADERAS